MKTSSDKQLELNSLIEFSQIINTNLNQEFILGNILLSIMGKMLISKGLILLNSDTISGNKKKFIVSAQKGISDLKVGSSLSFELPKTPVFSVDEIEGDKSVFSDKGLTIFFKIYFINKLLGILCLGNKANKASLERNEFIFIETLLNLSAPTIENALKFDQIKLLNINLNSQLQQLRALFEISKEFNTNFQDKEKILKLLKYSLLGNFGIKEIIIFSRFRSESYYILSADNDIIFSDDEIKELEYISEPELISDDTVNSLKKLLFENNYRLIIPVFSNNRVETIVCLSEKLNKSEFSLYDIQFLESLVNISVISIDNTILFKEFTEKEKIENELRIAREIQIALLPKFIPDIKGYDVAAINIPALQVGGDYYDVIPLQNNKYAIVIADVSGKGTPASLLMSNIQSAVHSFLKLYDDTFNISDVTKKINELVYQNTSSEKFITFFWGILDSINHNFTYVNAGHNPPILLSNNHSTCLDKGGLMLGVLENGVTYESETISLKKNDILILYTDGVSETMDNLGNEFGESGIICSIKNAGQMESEYYINRMIDDLKEFNNNLKQQDDITLIILKKD